MANSSFFTASGVSTKVINDLDTITEEAKAYKDAAAVSAAEAATDAAAINADINTAVSSASAAQLSAAAAANSAADTIGREVAADASAVASEASAVSSASSATASEASKVTAVASAVGATASESAAGTSASLASTKASEASNSQIAAASSETASAASQSSAATSAATATTEAAAASASASGAAASAVTGTTQASGAAASAATATTQASNAATSATAAATSAASASADASATAADTVATAADLAATNQDTIDTAADLVLTNADVVLTHADVVTTAANAAATAVSATNALTAASLVNGVVTPLNSEILWPAHLTTLPSGWYDTAQRLLAGTATRAILTNNPVYVYIESSLLPELVLDFAGSAYFVNGTVSTLSAATTYTGTSNGTMTDSDGLIKWKPHNRMRSSGDLTGTGWANNNMTVGAVTTGSPFGTYQTVSPSSTIAGASSRYQIGLPLLNGTTYVGWSLVKYSAGNGWFVIDLYDSGKSSERSWFDVQNGVVGTKDPLIIDHGMINYGDGWWLCWASSNAASTSGGLSVEVPTGDGVLASNSGDVVLFAGSQFNRSDLGGMVNNPATASSYVPTTSAAAVYLPRTGNHVYNGTAWVNEGLLLESEARTNLLTYSNDFTDVSWTKTSIIVTAAAAVSPDGTTNASELRANGTNYRLRIDGSFPPSPGTSSFYVKKAASDYVLLTVGGTNGYQALFNVNTGVLVDSTSLLSSVLTASTISDAGNGWFRLSISGTGTPGNSIGIAPTDSATMPSSIEAVGTSVVASVYIYGAQAEVGSTPSSYIPNAGATAGVTRAAETLTVPAANMPWPTPVETTGTELVTNGDFANGLTDYIEANTGTGSMSVSGGVLTLLGDSNSDRGVVYQRITATAGDLVAITVDIAAVTSGSLGIGLDSNTVFGSVLWDTVGVSTVGSVTKIIRTPYDNPYVVLFTNGGSADIDVNNISVKEINPLSVSIQMDGKMTYADDGEFHHQYLWQLNGANRVRGYVNTGVAYVGRQIIAQEVGNIEDTVALTGAYSPGINVPFNIAGRHGSTFINGAVDGTALTANTTPTALPDLSATDFQIGYTFMGNIGGLRVWADDLGDTGIAEASE